VTLRSRPPRPGFGLERRDLLRLLGGLTAAGALGTVSACTKASATPRASRGSRIPIGLISPATGALAPTGAELSQGFKLYLSTNGNLLGGHDVDLIEVDEGTTPDKVKAAVDALVARNVLALAGVANPQVDAARDSVENARTPLLSTNPSARDALAGSGFLWRTSYVDDEPGTTLGNYAGAQQDLGSAFLVYDTTAGDSDAASAFKDAFTKAGGQIAGERKVVATAVTPLLFNQAHASGAKLMFASYSGPSATQFLQQYADAGQLPLYGPGPLTESTVRADTVMHLPHEVYTSSPYATGLDNDSNRRFVAAYHQAYGALPTMYAMMAYDAALVLDLALQQLGDEPSQVDVNDALGTLGEILSPRGSWTFTPDRTPQQHWYLRRLALDGQVTDNLIDAELNAQT
jgi:branched-chain amino acid transport system substrate-binding protein